MKYKLFGNSGLRVSELCLGTMAFGAEEDWGCDRSESKKIFESFANAGGNFIDCANIYAHGEGERIVGALINSERDNFVLSTKYSFLVKEKDKTNPAAVNRIGNHRKNLMRSVEQSLARLSTDVIDVLWLHCPDGLTPLEEVMRALDDLIRQGKIHYIGVSNMPAWQIAKANTIAEFSGWSQFIGIQPEYNLLQRAAERELFPMAKELDIAITPWSPLAGGALTGKYLNDISKIELGYPHDFLQSNMVRKHAFADLLRDVENHRK